MKTNAVTLDDKYTFEAGVVVMSGIQALVRIPLDQHRADRRAGLRTATLISGYRGSPLGGFDMALQRAAKHLEEHDVRFLAGINEDLAATAVYGSQLSHAYPGAQFDGVLGIWYGKGPGVDRTGDVFRHANFAGVAHNGGVLAVAGDDPGAKSSTVPSASEVALFDAQMPILFPSTVQEILELGLKGFALSRYSGSWVGLKIVTNTADAFSSVMLTPERFETVMPPFDVLGQPWRPKQNPQLLAPWSLEQERELHEGRSEAVLRFAAANRLNRIAVDPAGAWLGIVAAGKTYLDVMEALATLGLEDRSLRSHGVRIMKLSMIYPLDANLVRQFARGLSDILVIEEKRPFLELFIRNALYGCANPPKIIGKYNLEGRATLPGYGELNADTIRPVLRALLLQRLPADGLPPEPSAAAQATTPQSDEVKRTPYFCSGCPHNLSTNVPAGSMANGAVGCSTMALWMGRETTNIVHMGGEGVQWVGASPFSDTPHIIQNMGDGTFLHSGSLAIRQAVAAGTNITYKILYNAAVAMTGGQRHDADLSAADVVKVLVAERVARVIVVSHIPDAFDSHSLPSNVAVWHRDRLLEAQEELRRVRGVTVLVYDQPCAAALRRERKRGLAAVPSTRVLINEAVCEGCGDCGQKSNCLSVHPVSTEFGRKTQIHQSSCNRDYSCTSGLCPSFVLVDAEPDFEPARQLHPAPIRPETLPEPPRPPAGRVNVLMMGIGGTGVVTVNQMLGVAAHLEDQYSVSLDQTGLAQKGGSVVSHLKISRTPLAESNLIGQGAADVLLVFDLVTAVQATNLSRASPSRTRAVINTGRTPTGPEVRDLRIAAPDVAVLLARIDAATVKSANQYLDADALAETAFGDQTPANLIVLGAAFQAGLIPLGWRSIERAIELNGAGVQANTQAFRLGRLWAVDSSAVATAEHSRSGALERRAILSPAEKSVFDAFHLPAAARAEATLRFAELIRYQSIAYARRYLTFVAWVAERDPAKDANLTRAVLRSLFRLMAYKDEYEVARLHLLPEFESVIARQYGNTARRRYLLQPQFLECIGVRRKIAVGGWIRLVFRALAASRGLRGTAFDLFGFSKHRRLERSLAGEFINPNANLDVRRA